VNRRVTAYWWAASLLVALAAIGWAIRSVPLALSGTLGAIPVLAGWVWQRECLTNLTYTRTVSQHRSTFGEEITLGIEIVNDKLLPLTWLHVEDTVPASLTIRGGTIEDGASRREAFLHLLLPILPFGRVRRRLTVVCDRRGVYKFGPARLESGDPIGFGRRTARLSEVDHLLVYPKVFALEPPNMASRMFLGDQRSSSILLGDPSRVAGVREYQAGDPLRHVDWRASARSPSLLVRVYEPTTSLRVATFVDPRVLGARGTIPPADLIEFTLAVAASVVTDLSVRGIGVGLYSTGTVDGRPLSYTPSTSPSALADLMELLARMSPYATTSMGELLAYECGRFRSGISVVVIATDFPQRTLASMADLRRRLPVTSVWVGNDVGAPPPPGTVDTREEVAYVADWKQRAAVELAR
jgi:uncharacterized protein (DUF58 family)